MHGKYKREKNQQIESCVIEIACLSLATSAS